MHIKKVTIFIYNALLLTSFPLSLYSSSHEDPAALRANIVQAKILHFPLYFEKNEGQADPSITYISRHPHGNLYFTSRDIVMALPSKTAPCLLTMQFVDMSSECLVEGIKEQQGKCHYFVGNDPKKWLTNVPTYAKIRYKEIYPGVDVIFYGNNGQLEYDICVAPGGNAHTICLRIEGATDLVLDGDENLQILTNDGKKIVMRRPCMYQMVEEKQIPITGKFVVVTHNTLQFHIGDYDATNPLVIDPVLDYSTYLGGSSQDIGVGIAVDEDNNVFVAGITNSPNFPTTPSAYQTTLMGAGNSFITKLNIAESQLVYSTYLGSGSSLRGDNASGLAIDNQGNAYVIGTTDSATFPTTPGAFQTTLNGLSNCFITKLNPTGSALVYSTYLGGSAVDRGDASAGIAVNQAGNAFVTGGTRSTDFPTTAGAYQEALASADGNCFVTQFNTTGTNLVYSTYLGGSNASDDGDRGYDITVDGGGNAYVTGSAQSSNFPTTPGAFQTTLAGRGNCFITKFNPAGSALVYSTLLGGSVFDEGLGITLDGEGNAYITGATTSSNFPSTPDAFQTTLNSTFSGFVTKLNATGSALIYSTFLGGNTGDVAESIAIDNQGNACVTGPTNSSDFPCTPDAFQTILLGDANCFVTKLNETGSDLIYSTYVGGSNFDVGTDITLSHDDTIYFTGFTASTDFPTTPNAYQTSLTGTNNCFIARFAFRPPAPSNFQGRKIENIFLTQTDYINHLSWTPSADAGEILGYKIFRDGLLIAQIPPSGPFFYNDHNRKKNQQYIYALVSFNDSLDSVPLTLTL